MKNKIIIFLLFSILGIFFLLTFLSAKHESLTYDEIVDFQEGRNAVLHHDFSVEPYNPPFTREVAIIPYVFQKNFSSGLSTILQNPLPGRFMMIICGMLLIAGVYFIGQKLVSPAVGLWGAFLLAFTPEIIAHSHYNTMDIGLGLFVFVAYFGSYFFLTNKSVPKKYIPLLGITIGLGIATKFSFLLYYLLSILILSVYLFKISIFFNFWVRKWQILLIALLAISTLWATYFFTSSVVIKQRSDANRFSSRLLSYAKLHRYTLLENSVLIAEKQKIPLGDFFALVKNNLLRPKPTSCFFLGTYYNTCNWYFMIINFLLKTPLPLLVLWAFSLYFFKDSQWEKEYMIILIPVISIFVLAGGSGVSPFIRYVLPVSPFIALMCGFIFNQVPKKVPRTFLLLMIVWLIGEVVTTFPHYISYSNELVGPRQENYKFFSDSNIDWGQSLPDVAYFLDTNKTKYVSFSYFGRADGDRYGLMSDKSYGSYKAPDICEFHHIGGESIITLTIISISNWWECGYYKQVKYKTPQGVLSDSFLLFK